MSNDFDDFSEEDGEEKSYEADFDAGVEADEDEDPKKFVQQLTGKLSQSLQDYQESLPQPDSSDAKYVGSMILSQVAKFLSVDDFNQMVKKAQEKTKGNEVDDISNDDEVEGDDTNKENFDDVDSVDDTEINESLRKKINELFDTIDKPDDEDKKDIKPSKAGEIGYTRAGYLPKNFK